MSFSLSAPKPKTWHWDLRFREYLADRSSTQHLAWIYIVGHTPHARVGSRLPFRKPNGVEVHLQYYKDSDPDEGEIYKRITDELGTYVEISVSWSLPVDMRSCEDMLACQQATHTECVIETKVRLSEVGC